MKGIVELMKQRPVVGDGGYLIELERRGYVDSGSGREQVGTGRGSGQFTPEVAIEQPDALRELHREFLGAGSEVLQALTFFGTREKLSRAGYGEQTETINAAAVRLAKEVAGDRALVAGSVSRTQLIEREGPDALPKARDHIAEQIRLLKDAGVDFLILETFFHLSEMKAALEAAAESGLPSIATMSFRPLVTQCSDGHTPAECARVMADHGAAAVGANCEQDPPRMLPLLRQMREAVSVPIAAQPAAFRTTDECHSFTRLAEFPDDLETIQISRSSFSEFGKAARNEGFGFVGGCCGANAAYIAALSRGLGRQLRVGNRRERGQVMAGTCAIGFDVGGTKCASGVVVLPEGTVVARRLQPTAPERGGDAVLTDVILSARALADEARQLGLEPCAVGVGVAELVSPDGEVLSAAMIPWQGMPVREKIRAGTGLPADVEADVRAAAKAEAVLGAGRHYGSFLFITVGTGISASLVVDKHPYAGARGLTGTFASSRGLVPADDGRLVGGPPLEQFASGPALASRFSAVRRDRDYTGPEVVTLCEAGDELARSVVGSAGEALGAAVAHLVNVLDPAAVVLGGGLGMVGGVYRESLELALRTHVWSVRHRDVPLVSAEMGVESGFIGAAITASDRLCRVGK